MITWDEFKKAVDAKIAESKVSEKEPEIRYIDISWPLRVDDFSITVNDQNQLEVT